MSYRHSLNAGWRGRGVVAAAAVVLWGGACQASAAGLYEGYVNLSAGSFTEGLKMDLHLNQSTLIASKIYDDSQSISAAGVEAGFEALGGLLQLHYTGSQGTQQAKEKLTQYWADYHVTFHNADDFVVEGRFSTFRKKLDRPSTYVYDSQVTRGMVIACIGDMSTSFANRSRSGGFIGFGLGWGQYDTRFDVDPAEQRNATFASFQVQSSSAPYVGAYTGGLMRGDDYYWGGRMVADLSFGAKATLDGQDTNADNTQVGSLTLQGIAGWELAPGMTFDVDATYRLEQVASGKGATSSSGTTTKYADLNLVQFSAFYALATLRMTF